MKSMASTIVPKSDQLNADDLLAGPITIKITDVAIKGGQEQPVAIGYEGDNGKPYKACKSMCRVLVSAWGADASKYVGRSLTLYCDPKVKWAGMEVGGIRISHMSDIDSSITMALTVTRANKKPFTVKPINGAATQATSSARHPAEPETAAPPIAPGQQSTAASIAVGDGAGSGATISADEALLIKAREWADCGTVKYKEWWLKLAPSQQKIIGVAQHEKLKLIAEKVPT